MKVLKRIILLLAVAVVVAGITLPLWMDKALPYFSELTGYLDKALAYFSELTRYLLRK